MAGAGRKHQVEQGLRNIKVRGSGTPPISWGGPCLWVGLGFFSPFLGDESEAACTLRQSSRPFILQKKILAKKI